jgi:hypothetical protein
MELITVVIKRRGDWRRVNKMQELADRGSWRLLCKS